MLQSVWDGAILGIGLGLILLGIVIAIYAVWFWISRRKK
jgi:hypothetical protein